MKKKETAQIAVRDNLSKALASIDEKLQSFVALETATFKTNGQFSWNPNYTNGNNVNIHTSTDLMLLVSIYTSLRTKNRDYEESVKELKLDTYPAYTWQGASWDNWKFDLQLRITVVGQDTVITKLKEQKSVLEKHLTEDEQLARTLAELGYGS